MNARDNLKRAWPSCQHLECTEECDPEEAYCGRTSEVFEAHNRAVMWTGLEQSTAERD